VPSFDGDNLVITLDSGVTAVDVQVDLYSDWKEWVKLSDNAKYPLAFRSIAGDPLSGALNAAPYYFFRNDNGWRIRPPEEDITISLTGNLVAEDSTIAVVIPTIGTFTTMVLGLAEQVISADEMKDNIDLVYQRAGLDSDIPVTITPTQITFGNITLTIGGDGVDTSTITRQ